MFKRQKKTRITDVDINRKEDTLYLVREYQSSGEDRTVAIFVSLDSAKQALEMIRKNRKISKNKFYEIENFHYVEHQNSLVGK